MGTAWTELGTVIRDFREAVPMSQRELAARLGVSQALVSKWESGDRTPTSLNRLLALASALDVPRETLLDAYEADRQASGDAA